MLLRQRIFIELILSYEFAPVQVCNQTLESKWAEVIEFVVNFMVLLKPLKCLSLFVSTRVKITFDARYLAQEVHTMYHTYNNYVSPTSQSMMHKCKILVSLNKPCRPEITTEMFYTRNFTPNNEEWCFVRSENIF